MEELLAGVERQEEATSLSGKENLLHERRERADPSITRAPRERDWLSLDREILPEMPGDGLKVRIERRASLPEGLEVDLHDAATRVLLHGELQHMVELPRL